MNAHRPNERAPATDPGQTREMSPVSVPQIPDASTQTPPASAASPPHPAFQAAIEILRRDTAAPPRTPNPGPQPPSSPPQTPGPRSDTVPSLPPAPDPIPARMLNEFVYCPRLFYYEHVEGVFLESADTARGAVIHRRVDSGKGDLPPSAAAHGQFMKRT